MKNKLLKLIKLVAMFSIVGASAFASFASADVTNSFWAKQQNGQLYTNSGNGLGNAIINVAGCNGCGSGSGFAIGEAITGGTPKEVIYTDNSGDVYSDALFIRDSLSNETQIGFETYAQGEANDGVSEQVIWRADNPGETGNTISLVFDGVDNVDTVLAAWNAANPSNTASAIYQSSNFVPTAQTVNLDGGGDASLVLTLDADGSGLQLIGSQFSNSEKTALIGLLNTTGVTQPFLGAFDLVTGEGVFMGMNTRGYEISTETLSGNYIRQFLNQSGAGFRFENSSNNTTVFDVRDMEVSAVIPSSLGYEYTLLGDGSAGYIQMSATDNSDYTGTIRATHSLNLIKSDNTLFGSSNLLQTSSSSVIAYSDGSAGTSQIALSSNIFTLTDGSNSFISVDTATADITIGDIDIVGNGTLIQVDDTNSLFSFNTGIIRGNNFHNNGSVSQGSATQQDVRSGTYTPTLTNVTNISSSTAYKFQWMRVGNVVTVSGRVNITNTATGAAALGISLPIASNIGATTDCVGSAPGSTSGILDDVGWIIGDATNNRATMESTATSTAAHDHWVSFTYEVI